MSHVTKPAVSPAAVAAALVLIVVGASAAAIYFYYASSGPGDDGNPFTPPPETRVVDLGFSAIDQDGGEWYNPGYPYYFAKIESKYFNAIDGSKQIGLPMNWSYGWLTFFFKGFKSSANLTAIIGQSLYCSNGSSKVFVLHADYTKNANLNADDYFVIFQHTTGQWYTYHLAMAPALPVGQPTLSSFLSSYYLMWSGY